MVEKPRDSEQQAPGLGVLSPSTIQRLNMAYDWTGPDDPDNPRNSPLWFRVFGITTVALLAFSSAFAGAIYAPALDDVMRSFHCTYEVAVLPLSFYNLGLAFGPVFGAPLSEKYGRKAVFVLGTPIFMLFMVGSGFTKTPTSLILCRFFAGMFASSNINNAAATIMDYTASRHRGISVGMYYSSPSAATTLAPLIGGFVVQAKNWQWTQWTAVMVTVATYLPVLLTKETYKKVILQRRAIRLGLSDASSQSTSMRRAFRHFLTVLVQRPLHMLFTEPIVTLVSLYNGFIHGLLYAFVIAVPWISGHYYDFNKSGQSLSYLGSSLGTLIAGLLLALIDIFFYQKRLRHWELTRDSNDLLPPENRLVAAMVGSFLLPASLIIAGWTAEYRIHWIVPIFFQGFTMLSSMLIYASVSLFLMDSYGPLYGASASSAMMLSRYMLSFLFPLFTRRMFQGLGAGWATSVLALLGFIFAPIPWCFWIYGERLRKRSRYETST